MARNAWHAIVAPLALAGTLALILGLAIPARAEQHSGHTSQAGATLTIYAAASLKEAFTTIGQRFAARYHVPAPRFNFGGSDTLATGIIQGAPADVFASANGTQMTLVQGKGLLSSTPRVFVHNRLVAMVPASNPGHVYSLPDLGRPGLRLVLAEPKVPVGKYARAAFALMANDAAFGPDFLARIKRNIVSNESDVKAVAAKVVLGEADAGIVYVTDVTAQVAPKVQRIEIPAPYNQIAAYPIAVTRSSKNQELAREFVAYVLSSAGQAVLKRAGFITGGPAGAYASSLRVSGLVGKPRTLSVSDLRRLPATTVTATLRSDNKTTLGTARYTGVLLNTIVQAAAPVSNTSYKNGMLRQFVTVVGSDGYQATVAMAEMLPRFGHEKVLLAYSKNGKALPRGEGAVELIVPGDALAGRDVKNVTGIVVGAPTGTP